MLMCRSVMGASLCLLYDLVKADPAPYKDLVPSFVSILKQITEHRLPRYYELLVDCIKCTTMRCKAMPACMLCSFIAVLSTDCVCNCCLVLLVCVVLVCREYDYHRMPAPWIQMRLLQVRCY
jgi:hypothetical protein